MMFFENPPPPLPLKGLHLSLYPLSSGEGKNSGLQRPQTFACFSIAGRRDGVLSADAKRRGMEIAEKRNYGDRDL